MAKKRKHQISGTKYGKDQALTKATEACRDFGRDIPHRERHRDACQRGVELAHKEEVTGERHIEKCSKLRGGLVFTCRHGVWKFKNALKELPAYIAGKRRRR